jgi:outer membrane protein
MKRGNAALLLWLAPLPAVVSQAQSSPSQAATQGIAVVTFNAVVLQTAEAQKELGALQAKFAPRQSQLQALEDEVDALRKQLSDNQLSDQERETRQRSLDQKEKQLQRQSEDFRNDSQTESQLLFQRVAQKVYAFLQTYAQQHGYSVVIERGSDTTPVVWYAANNLDITEQVIKAYNARAGVAPAKALPQAPLPH